MATPTLVINDQLIGLRNSFWKSQSLTALVVSILRQEFADANNITQSTLQNYLWKPDDTTGILIEAIGRWKPTLTQKRLALVVKRNGQKTLNLGIGGNRMQMGFPPNAPGATKDIRAVYFQGTHTVFCIGKESAETETLAAEVYRYLVGFAPKIRELMCMIKFMVTEIGELSLLEESYEHFIVPITVAYVYEDSWEIQTQSAGPLRQVSLQVTT